MLSERLSVRRRHQLWIELAAVADHLCELTELCLRLDPDLASEHYERSEIDRAQLELPLGINQPTK